MRNLSRKEDTQTDIFDIIKKPKVSKGRRGTDGYIKACKKTGLLVNLFSNEWAYFLTITFNGSRYDFSNADFVKEKT